MGKKGAKKKSSSMGHGSHVGFQGFDMDFDRTLSSISGSVQSAFGGIMPVVIQHTGNSAFNDPFFTKPFGNFCSTPVHCANVSPQNHMGYVGRVQHNVPVDYQRSHTYRQGNTVFTNTEGRQGNTYNYSSSSFSDNRPHHNVHANHNALHNRNSYADAVYRMHKCAESGGNRYNGMSNDLNVIRNEYQAKAEKYNKYAEKVQKYVEQYWQKDVQFRKDHAQEYTKVCEEYSFYTKDIKNIQKEKNFAYEQLFHTECPTPALHKPATFANIGVQKSHDMTAHHQQQDHGVNAHHQAKHTASQDMGGNTHLQGQHYAREEHSNSSVHQGTRGMQKSSSVSSGNEGFKNTGGVHHNVCHDAKEVIKSKEFSDTAHSLSQYAHMDSHDSHQNHSNYTPPEHVNGVQNDNASSHTFQ